VVRESTWVESIVHSVCGTRGLVPFLAEVAPRARRFRLPVLLIHLRPMNQTTPADFTLFSPMLRIHLDSLARNAAYAAWPAPCDPTD
jgi:hypothetical protein